jgi:3-oxoacyl-[acyl-carrier-protein] synthase-1
MRTFIISDNIISPLGTTTAENFEKVSQGKSAINLINSGLMPSGSIYASSIADQHSFDPLPDQYTRFEKLCILSASDALAQAGINGMEQKTIFVLSTTKGNIDLIEKKTSTSFLSDIGLQYTAQRIASYFHAVNKPIVVSNACISGVLAIILAKRLLESGRYQHAVVIGADILSGFVVSGFQSLMAMSDEPCRPFDKDRKGINLGEGAATIILTTDPGLTEPNSIQVMGEGVTNDANHISGPSRTGLELADAVSKAMTRSKINRDDLSFVSAHGTATIYNDEMESKAFDLAGLNDVPLHSLKGYFGHTLGAAGVIESVMTIQSLRAKKILPSANFAHLGVPKSINVNIKLADSDKYQALKTASGFGGCNAALVYSNIN